MRLVEKKLLGRDGKIRLKMVAEAIGNRLQNGEGIDVGIFLDRVAATSGERHLYLMAGCRRRAFDGSTAGKHDQIGHRHLLAAGRRGVERGLYAFQRGQHLVELCRLVDLPVTLRRQTQTRAIRATTLVRPAIGRG